MFNLFEKKEGSVSIFEKKDGASGLFDKKDGKADVSTTGGIFDKKEGGVTGGLFDKKEGATTGGLFDKIEPSTGLFNPLVKPYETKPVASSTAAPAMPSLFSKPVINSSEESAKEVKPVAS
jgi:hypothetical protein